MVRVAAILCMRAVEEHLNDVVGRLCREVGDEARAAKNFLALLQVGQGESLSHCV